MIDLQLAAGLPAVEWLPRVLLHPGHQTETPSSATFDWTFSLAVVLLVGSVGGLLYWYYGRQVGAS